MKTPPPWEDLDLTPHTFTVRPGEKYGWWATYHHGLLYEPYSSIWRPTLKGIQRAGARGTARRTKDRLRRLEKKAQL